MSDRLPPLSILGALLVVAAIARLAGVVVNDPMLGFANQYDMLRTGACVGLYPDLPPEKRDAATPEAPLERYRVAGRDGQNCDPGPEALLAGLVVAKHWMLGTQGAAFPALRELGILKLVLAAAAFLALAAAFWRYPAAALLNGATAFFVMADPVVSLWFQTLYTEFPVMLGLYLLIGALVAGVLREALPVGLAILAGVGTVLVAFTKPSLMLLPIALLLVAMPRLWATSRRALLVLVALSGVALLWHAVLPRPPAIAQASRTNTYLGLLLPASPNPAAAAKTLGLAERCGELSGVTWNLRRGANLDAECPEVLKLSALAFLRLVPEDPETLARGFARTLSATQNPLLGDRGVVAGKPGAGLEEAPTWARSLWAPAVMNLPAIAYVGLVFAALCGLLAAGAFWGMTLLRGANADAHAYGAYTTMLVLVIGYFAAAAAFGEGLAEAARHNLPGSLALAALVLAALFAIGRPGDVGWGLRMVALVTGLVAIAGGLAATMWVQRQSIALGAIEIPAGTEVPKDELVVRGWALDLTGVRAVHVRLGERNIRVGRESLLPSAPLAKVHGGFPGSMWGNFEVHVPVDQVTAPEVPMRVEVENSVGIMTVIDRRRLKSTP